MLRFKLHHLFAFSLLVTALCHRPAQALGVNFDLEDAITPAALNREPTSTPLSNSNSQITENQDFEPLPIPPEAYQPPVSITKSTGTLPDNVVASARILTPPPTEAIPVARILPPKNNPPSAPQIDSQAIALSFAPQNSTVMTPDAQTVATNSQQSLLPPWIYEGGSNSLVARVIGSAEGTRTSSGKPTRAYYGHTDPGNGVWNLGTFSYQHGASSPSEADTKQLKRLQRQGKTIAKQAKQAELNLTLNEALNGLDLANQSPNAALENGGYIDRLAQARKQGMKNSDAIVWARTYAYWDPRIQRWNAPGLGNTLPSIQRDQTRRHRAIDSAFSHFQAQRETTGEPFAETLTVPINVANSEDTAQSLTDESSKVLEDSSVIFSQPIQLAFGIPDDWSLKYQDSDSPNIVTSTSETDTSTATTNPSILEDASQARMISNSDEAELQS